AAIRQIDRQWRGHCSGRQCVGRDVRDDLVRDKGRRKGKRGTDSTSLHRHRTEELGKNDGWTEKMKTLVASGEVPFNVIVHVVVVVSAITAPPAVAAEVNVTVPVELAP